MKTLKLKTIIFLILCIDFFSYATPKMHNDKTINYHKKTHNNDSNLKSLTQVNEWKLCYESDQIYIYERWIPVTSDHYIKERKGEMYVNCSIEKSLKMIYDYQNIQKWNTSVKENKLIKKNSPSNWVLYTLFELPWPLQNRDIVSEYEVQFVVPSSLIIIKIKSNDEMISRFDGISRITKYNASWTLKKITNQKCWICFSATCDNPPVISRTIQDPIVRKSFHKNLLGLKNVLE